MVSAPVPQAGTLVLITSIAVRRRSWLTGPAAGSRSRPVILEIPPGILVGPRVLGWVGDAGGDRHASRLGPTMRILLAGYETEFDKVRG